ncbi:hypothetical protein [Prevotella falsenii]|uniref:hypothetical protein n=1 Tax=Prevotella falsenii TaxID=515414 RepID=UPI0012ECB85E|nr:hypothetical protein [Prevotella falsenii]
MKPLAENILANLYTVHRNNGAGMLYAQAVRCFRPFGNLRLSDLMVSVPLLHLAFSIETILRMLCPHLRYKEMQAEHSAFPPLHTLG